MICHPEFRSRVAARHAIIGTVRPEVRFAKANSREYAGADLRQVVSAAKGGKIRHGLPNFLRDCKIERLEKRVART